MHCFIKPNQRMANKLMYNTLVMKHSHGSKALISLGTSQPHSLDVEPVYPNRLAASTLNKSAAIWLQVCPNLEEK